MFGGQRLKNVVNFFGEEKCTPQIEKNLATPVAVTEINMNLYLQLFVVLVPAVAINVVFFTTNTKKTF